MHRMRLHDESNMKTRLGAGFFFLFVPSTSFCFESLMAVRRVTGLCTTVVAYPLTLLGAWKTDHCLYKVVIASIDQQAVTEWQSLGYGL